MILKGFSYVNIFKRYDLNLKRKEQTTITILKKNVSTKERKKTW